MTGQRPGRTDLDVRELRPRVPASDSLPHPSRTIVCVETATATRDRKHGEVFTRRWVVDFILDLAGYTANRDLGALHAVEPSCGTGAFLGPMVERLIESCRRHGRDLASTSDAITATDLLPDNVAASRCVVDELLTDAGLAAETADSLAAMWVTTNDYLLTQPEYDGLFGAMTVPSVDFVIGNPPYIRPEDVPTSLYETYRRTWPTMLGRADVYVAFFEAALRSLAPNGVVVFICADRWMRNQYGRGLRSLITSDYAIDLILPMHDVDAFEAQVSAYPAIVVLRNGEQRSAALAEAGASFSEDDTATLLDWYRSSTGSVASGRFSATRLSKWTGGDASWPGGDPQVVAIVEALNERFEPLENLCTGTRVGIGVATGADELFVTSDTTLVERERLLPLTMSRDTTSGDVQWGGTYLVNPWEEDGSLVDLAKYPQLSNYFNNHGAALRLRHVANKAVDRWYRTIDKVDHSLVDRPKLLFPDMKMTTHPVLESGGLYPHHNLYYVVSDKWDLRVLGGLLLSKVAEAFVASYCVKMRGGTLRFQAQYLRRIRVPAPDTLSADDQAALAYAFDRRDAAAATEIAIRLYGLADRDATVIRGR